MDLPTYTNIWRIEKRLYKLYDFRLPMPLPVGQIAVFLVIAVPYVLVLSLLGLPFSHTLLWVYVLPPGVLAWLTTRPVLEGKRLPELVLSQLRYLLEPKTWCRMAPLAEKDEIVFVCRVWRQAEPVLADEPEAEPAVAVAPAAVRRVAARSLALTTPPVPRQLAPGRPAPRQVAPGQRMPGQQMPGQQTPRQQARGRETPVAPPVVAPPVVAPPVVARPVVAPPVVARPVVARPVVAPAASRRDRPAGVPPPRPARPVVTVTGDLAAERPLPVVERALRSQPGQRREGWRDRVVVVPGGHRPGKPDQLQRDRARARLPVAGPRRIVVLGCTRGAGQTMTVLLAGDMLASLRGEPVAVLDLNPGRGSLAERAAAIPGLVQDSPGVTGGSAAGLAEPGLQVISGSMAAGGNDAGRILDLVAARYPLTLADPAAGYVPRTLEVADQLLLIAPASAEAASALAMTFEWLEAHGHGRLAASAITVLNGVSGPTRSHVEHAAAVASGRCRAIVKVPWDGHLKDLMQERASAPAQPRPAEPAAGTTAVLAAPTGPSPTGSLPAGPPVAGHGGTGVLSPALTQAYTALAGVLIAGLADPAELRSAGSAQ